MRLYLYLIFFAISGLCNRTVAQTDLSGKEDKISWSIYTLTSAHLETVKGPESDTWSDIGFGGGMTYQFDSGFGINTRINFRQWERFGFDKSSIPLYVGPFYQFRKDSKISFALYGGVGPALIWGNDYASVFASFDLGAGIYLPVWSNNEIFFQVGFAQGMSFNSGFNYLDFSLGLRL
jgi:hypothetical protein